MKSCHTGPDTLQRNDPLATSLTSTVIRSVRNGSGEVAGRVVKTGAAALPIKCRSLAAKQQQPVPHVKRGGIAFLTLSYTHTLTNTWLFGEDENTSSFNYRLIYFPSHTHTHTQLRWKEGDAARGKDDAFTFSTRLHCYVITFLASRILRRMHTVSSKSMLRRWTVFYVIAVRHFALRFKYLDSERCCGAGTQKMIQILRTRLLMVS